MTPHFTASNLERENAIIAPKAFRVNQRLFVVLWSETNSVIFAKLRLNKINTNSLSKIVYTQVQLQQIFQQLLTIVNQSRYSH